ncbi:NADP-dependent phosphogluconate dehydrogenase [Peptoanaerobacter stomatis]|uniref:NADP-dependent phosphogluconate dehydrogenase n=1 Tax=Peptoanaerobacter stomatis TaxID=796937 RepID=UPI003F9F1B13
MKSNIGLIGLSVMGTNLALNMADKGYKVSIFNRTVSVIDEVMNNTPHNNFLPVYSLRELIDSLEKPRKIMFMIKAGEAVDKLIEQLLEFVEKDDILIDGGNSYFKDTIRRKNYLAQKGINYVGAGVSGGEEGARFGPAIMVGTDENIYPAVKNIFEDISAKVDDEPCCAYISTDGAGHYVKMVHNGIEYADMQLISEAYLILKQIGKLSNDELHEVFDDWNKSELESYLIEITSDIFSVKDDNKSYLIDKILDVANQKGTGKWTNLEAIDLGVDISTITSALNGRFMSTLKDEREKASKIFKKEDINVNIDKKDLIELVKYSLYTSKIVAYAQGFKLLSKAQKTYGWDLDFSKIAEIFRGGCIIRAKFLNDISNAFEKNKNIENLIFTDFFLNQINKNISSLRKLVSMCALSGVSIYAMSSALSYIDTYSTSVLGANLIQAQRDYFGAHTFERIDKEGVFHFDWIKSLNK